MNFRKVLLGTSAIVGATALVSPANAGDLDVGISGFIKTLAAFGELDNESGVDKSHSHYFRNDTEVHVKANSTDDETGLKYGMTVEFEADTSSSLNSDETWMYISGGFGELRFGDEDGASDNMKITAGSIAAGTGGIDGAGEVVSTRLALSNSSDATKVIYYSPVVSGFQVGVSYTPDAGHNGATENPTTDGANDYQDMVEAGATYMGSFGGLDLKGSVVGFHAKNESGGNNDSGLGGGASVGFSGFTVAGGYFHQDDADVWNAGVRAALGPANVSFNYGSQDVDGTNADPTNYVISADIGILPGLALEGDVSFFDRDTGNGNDDGVTGVTRLSLAF
ncbi:MAG: porin [Geminicoccaceae bacterium]|nr:porin [Geminicoccaceae bacterium]